MPALVSNPDDIKLAMLGYVDDNAHPYSWSAIFNGYDPEQMANCPSPGIFEYLSKEPFESIPIRGARVTHVWADDPGRAEHVARAARIPNVVREAHEVIGQVDAVVIPIDRGREHVERCRPFVEAGLPVFVDKPLTDNEPDLEVFVGWVAEGKPIMSCSGLRYAKEFMPYAASSHDLGNLRLVVSATHKGWERYGIHALEAVYPILGPGFLSAQNTGDANRNVVHVKHRNGADVIVVATEDLTGSFGVVLLCGTSGHVNLRFRDSFFAFKQQLEAFVSFLRSGVRPFPFSETVELTKLVIAGHRSREHDGRVVCLSEICPGY